jgi:hypothetical protein
MSETDPYAAPEGLVTEEAKVFDAPAEEAPQEAVEAPVDAVPAGSIKEVLAWVGSDATKAQKALDAEKSSDDPRSSLITKLEAITN